MQKGKAWLTLNYPKYSNDVNARHVLCKYLYTNYRELELEHKVLPELVP